MHLVQKIILERNIYFLTDRAVKTMYIFLFHEKAATLHFIRKTYLFSSASTELITKITTHLFELNFIIDCLPSYLRSYYNAFICILLQPLNFGLKKNQIIPRYTCIFSFNQISHMAYYYNLGILSAVHHTLFNLRIVSYQLVNYGRSIRISCRFVFI